MDFTNQKHPRNPLGIAKDKLGLFFHRKIINNMIYFFLGRTLLNVASQKYHASCSASSEFSGDYKCDNALDETLTYWIDRATPVWIQIQFTGAFYIVEARLRSRRNKGSRVKDVSISIGNMSPQSVCINIL